MARGRGVFTALLEKRQEGRPALFSSCAGAELFPLAGVERRETYAREKSGEREGKQASAHAPSGSGAGACERVGNLPEGIALKEEVEKIAGQRFLSGAWGAAM